MKITVQRNPSYAYATIGTLYVDGVKYCHTLEDQVREQFGVHVSEWKVKGSTAIPAGTYKVTLEDSQHFGPNTLTINDVPGFTGVRIHAGNSSDDTEGCLLLGMQVGSSTITGGTSRPALELIKSSVAKAIDDGEEVTLDVKNALVQA
jgi:hypothetical protein